MIKKKGILSIIYYLFNKYVYNKFKKLFNRWLILLFIICIALAFSTMIIFWIGNDKWENNSPSNFNSSIDLVNTISSFIMLENKEKPYIYITWIPRSITIFNMIYMKMM